MKEVSHNPSLLVTRALGSLYEHDMHVRQLKSYTCGLEAPATSAHYFFLAPFQRNCDLNQDGGVGGVRTNAVRLTNWWLCQQRDKVPRICYHHLYILSAIS